MGEQTLPIRREIPHLHQEFVARGEASRGVLQNSARAARGGAGEGCCRGGWVETSLAGAARAGKEVDGYSRRRNRIGSADQDFFFSF